MNEDPTVAVFLIEFVALLLEGKVTSMLEASLCAMIWTSKSSSICLGCNGHLRLRDTCFDALDEMGDESKRRSIEEGHFSRSQVNKE